MDAAADTLHTIANQLSSPPSPPRKPRAHSLRMWLSTQVGAAEAALATVFVGGTAFAASPSRRRKREHDDILPPLSETPELTLADAWAAVKRAAAAAMAAFENGREEDMGESSQHLEDHDECQESRCEECEAAARGDAQGTDRACEEQDDEERDSVSLGEKTMSDVTIEETHQAASLLPDADCEVDTPRMFEEKGIVAEVGEEEVKLSPCKLDGTVVEETLASRGGRKEFDAETTLHLAELRHSFDDMFAQNGGTECVARVKQLGDDALMNMRDTTDMDSKMLAELDDVKLILDDALCRLNAAMRSQVNEGNPEYANAAAAAMAVIEETSENARAGILVSDGSRLLAVFAARVCAAVLECLEDNRGEPWSERVQRMAGIATVGVSQLRTVSYKFAEALMASGGEIEHAGDSKRVLPLEIERLNDIAIEHVLQCVALSIAALQMEAAERAHICST